VIARANSILQTRVLLALWPGLLASCSIAWAGEAVLEADFHSRWAKRVFAETAPAPPRNRLRVVHEEEPGGLSRAWEVGSELPFSFVYDAKPSRELLGNWKRTVCKEPIDPVRRRIVQARQVVHRLGLAAIDVAHGKPHEDVRRPIVGLDLVCVQFVNRSTGEL